MNLPSSSCIFPCHPVHVLWRVQCSMSIFIAMGPYYSRFIRVCSAVVKIQGCVTYSGQRNKLPLAPVFEAVRFVNPQPRACWKPSHRHCSWKKLRVAASFSQWFPTFEFILTDPLLGVTILPEYFPNLLLGIMILQEYFPDFLLGVWPPTVKEANVINKGSHSCFWSWPWWEEVFSLLMHSVWWILGQCICLKKLLRLLLTFDMRRCSRLTQLMT